MKIRLSVMICLLLICSQTANAIPLGKRETLFASLLSGLLWTQSFLVQAYLTQESPNGNLRGLSSGMLGGKTANEIFDDSENRYHLVLEQIGKESQTSKALIPKSEFYNVSVSLPQFDSDPERAQALLAFQAAIQNSNKTWAYNGIDTVAIPRGPIPYPGSLAQKMTYEEAIDLVSRETANSGTILTNAVANLPVATLADIENLFRAFPTNYPFPAGLTNWTNDAYFADMRRTYLGHNLKRLTKPLFHLQLNNAQTEELLGKGKTLDQIELYGSDFWSVGNYTARDGRLHYAPSAQAMYGFNTDGQFVVLGIRLGNGFVYTRFDSPDEWLLAKIAVNTAEFLWTSANHFLTTHLLLLPMRTEMIRHLSEKHPLSILLSTAMKDLYGLGFAGFTQLFSQGTVLDLVSGWGAEGYMRFYGDHISDATDTFLSTLKVDLDERGLKNLPHFRQAQYKAQVLANIRAFVKNYLSAFYGSKQIANHNVLNDYELQNWAQACQSSDGAGIGSFPAKITTFKQLVATVTQILYLATLKHHGMNANALWHGNSQPATSMALWAPLPTQKGANVNVRSYLAPTKDIVMLQILLNEKFLRNLSLSDSIKGAYSWLVPVRKNMKMTFEHYQKSLQRTQNEIESKEKQGEGVQAPLRIFEPEALPDFSWI